MLKAIKGKSPTSTELKAHTECMLVAQGTADCLVSRRALDYLWYCIPKSFISSFF